MSELHSYKKNDTGRVRLLRAIASNFKDINLDSTTYYANKGLALAEQLNYETGVAICKHLLGMVYLRRVKYDSALDYYETALHIYEKTNDKKSQCQVLRSIADIYYRKSRPDVAVEYYNKSIRINKETNDYISEGLSYVNIACIFEDSSNHIESINYFLEGLKAFEKGKSEQNIAMTLVDIATVYTAIGNNIKATEYINKSLAINVTDRVVLFSNYVNSGDAYGQMKDYKKALSLFLKARVLADSIGDLSWKNICLINIADAYYKTDSFDKAYSMYTEVLRQNETIKDSMVLAVAKCVIGAITVKRGQTAEGIKLLLEALNIAKLRGYKRTIFDASRNLAEAYEKQHNYKEALYYHKLYHNYSDSLYNEKTDKRLSQMQFDYELGKKESQIALLNKDKEIQLGKNERQKVLTRALLAGLFLLIIISLLLYRNIMQQKRNKERILGQKDEIEKQAARLEELNHFKDKTFSVLSHDLRGPLGSVTATIKMLDEAMLTPEEFAEMKPEADKQLRSLNILLDNLLQWAKNYIQGHAIASPAKVNVLEATLYSADLLNDTAASKGISIENNIPSSINVLFDPEQFQIICRNIIMNAIKFTPNGGKVSLNAVAKGDRAHFSISDTGVGMTKEQLNKLFTSTTENTTYGTEGERGTGLGLLLCYEFMKANNSSISVSSEAGMGTIFKLEMPLIS